MSQNDPFFSVIIPTFNRADLIGKTLDSVLAQSFSGFEVLVIDDGSTDNTRAIVESYKDKRMQYIWQKNSERGAARNNGIKHAKGQYVTFLDSDDLYLPEHLETVYRNLEGLKFPVFFHQTYRIIEPDGKINYRPFNAKKEPVKRLITEGNFMGSVGLFIEKNTAMLHFFDEERILAGSEDYEMLLRLILNVPVFLGKEETTLVINHDQRGEFRINKEKLIARKTYFLNKVLSNKEFLSKYSKYIPTFKASTYGFIALHLAVHRHKKEAWSYWKKASKSSLAFCISRRSLIIFKYLIFN